MTIDSKIPSLKVTDTALEVSIGGQKLQSLEKSKFGIIGWLFGQNVGIQLDYMKNGKEVKGEWVYIKKSSVDSFNQKNPVDSKTAEGPGHKFVNKLISLYRDSKITNVPLDKPGVARLTVQSVFVLSGKDLIDLKSFLSKYGLKLPDGYVPGAILGPVARARFINGLEKANPNKNESDWKIIHQQIDGYFGALSDEVGMQPNPLRAGRAAPSPAPSPATVDAVEVEAERSPATTPIPYNAKYVLSGDVVEGVVSRAGVLVESFTSPEVSVEDLVKKFTAHVDWASTTKKNTNYQHFHQVVYLLKGMIPMAVKGQAKPQPKFENGPVVMKKLCEVADALGPEDKKKLNAFLNKVSGSTELNVLIASLQFHLRPPAAK